MIVNQRLVTGSNNMKSLLNWFVLSSENPKEVALSIRGLLILQVPLLASFLNEIGILDSGDTLVAYVTAITATLGIFLLVIGIVRKIVNTVWPKKVAKKKR